VFSIKGKFYEGAVIINAHVSDPSGDLVFSYGFDRSYIDSQNEITFKPVYYRFLPFVVKRVEHISKVYERKIGDFEQDIKRSINRRIDDLEEKKSEQEITDGLPD